MAREGNAYNGSGRLGRVCVGRLAALALATLILLAFWLVASTLPAQAQTGGIQAPDNGQTPSNPIEAPDNSDEGGGEQGEGTTNTIGDQTGATDPSNEGEGTTNTMADQMEGGDDSGGFLNGIAVGMVKAIGDWIGAGIEKEAERRTADLASQLTQGRYMIEAPNNELTGIYRETADWAKFAAIPALLLLALSMCLRGVNYDTTYAAQTGIPRIVTMMAAIAFMPEIIGLIADMAQSISNAVIDLDAMQQGFERLARGEMVRGLSPAASIIVWIIKGVYSVLLQFAVAVQNLIFGVLYMVGPIAMIFYAIPRFSDIAAAWFRGILASFAISVIWALEFGFGYRLVGDPTLLYEGTGWRFLPLLLSLGILWLAWKTPWWIYQWAFYSYSAGGGGSGVGTALRAVGLLKLFSGKGK